MAYHYFQPTPGNSFVCEACEESEDEGQHYERSVENAEEDGPGGYAPDDWPPNVVAYLEAVGIRNPRGV